MQAEMDEKSGDSDQQAEREPALPRRIKAVGLAEVRIGRGPERDHDQKRQSPKRGELLISSKFQVSSSKSKIRRMAIFRVPSSKFQVGRTLERGLSNGEPASEFQVGRQKLQSV